MNTTSTDARPMLAEIIPSRVLPRSLTRFDMVTIYFALIFGSYGAAQLAAQGWAAIPMLLIAVLTVLLPCALASYELGTLFPGEGGVYVWAHKTMGPIHGFISGWLGWVPIFLLLPLGATTVTAHIQFALGVKWPLWAQVVCQLAVINSVSLISLMRLKFSQGYVRIVFFVALGTAVIALLAGFFTDPPATPVNSDIRAWNIFAYGPLYSAAILWLLGVEVPFNMGDEFSDHKKTAGTMLKWGTVALVLGYIFGIVGILWTTPQASVDGVTGVAGAAAKLGTWAGVLVALGICFAVISQGVSYMNSYSRLLFISGIEKRLPSFLGHVNERTRVPVPALLVQALGANILILIFSTQTNLTVAFNLYLGSLVAVWCASLYYLYIGLIRARTLYADRYIAPGSKVWRVPGGRVGVWAVALWGAVFNTLAIYYVFAVPWTTDASNETWRTWLLWISLTIIALGLVIYLAGRKRAESVNIEEEVRRFDLATKNN